MYIKYTQKPIRELMDKLGGFFAIGTEQFNKKKQPDVVYTDLGMGLVAPVENAKELVEGRKAIYKRAIEQVLEDNKREDVIRYELANYESYYSGCIDDACEALEIYNITRDEVQKVFKIEYTKWCNS